MSSLGRGRGRGRPPITPNQDQEGVQRSPAAAVEGNPTEDVAAAVVPPVPRRQEVTMQELVERYADPDQPEELQALREMAIMQIASPASPEGQTPKDTSNRGRFRGRGVVSAVNIPAIDVGGGHGQPIAIAAPSRPRSPPLPLAAQLAVAGSSGSGAVGQRPPSSGSASGYYRTAVGSASGISGAPVSVAQPEQPPVVAPVVQPEQPSVVAPVVQPQPDDAEIANRAVETAVTAKSPPVELPIISRVGTKGARLDVATNYIRLKLATGRPGIVEYHVSYSVPIESVAIRRKALKQFEHRLGLVKSFDGMILFLPYILDDDVTVLHGIHPIDADVELTAHVTFVKVKPMKEAIPFFNILLRRIMIELGFVEIRREFYDLELAQFLKQHRLEIWPGFNPVAENQEDGLMINVDACSRVLRMDTVYDYYLMVKGDPKGKTKFNEFVVNKIVITKYNHVTYRVDDVAWDMTPMTEFERKGQTCTFVDYLKHHHNYIVKDTTQPMLISKLKPRKNDRLTQSDATQRVAALVPECCHMTGLTEDQRNNFKVMTDLAGSTRLTPQQRVEGLKRFIDRLMKCEPAQELLSQWSLEIVPGIIHVEGRKMDGPGLSFGDRVNLSKAGPDFSREAGLSVYDPIEVKRYAVISTQRDSDKAKRFIEMYQQVSKPLGIKMMQLGTLVTLRGFMPHDFNNALRGLDQNTTQFVVIIMPMQRDDVYAAIKKFCVSDCPIPSQCILSKTLGNEKRLRSIVLKIALQINCKLGGSLWALQMPLKEQVMFVGIDAAHDPLKKDPSTVCLVASLNNECTKYYSKAASGRVHQEMAESLRGMLEDAINYFQSVRHRVPDRIIVFRDGGSVGAMEHIEKTEMEQLMQAQQKLAPDASFTFAVVAKRIPQRFFLDQGRKGFDNLQPGSVVDNTVTRRHYFDFYMVSQQVRQGTVNPTHFIVLNPNDAIKTDLIQKLAYVTSFMYFNWSGTVRVPAMVQYAHKLADLLSRHVKAKPHETICNTLYYL